MVGQQAWSTAGSVSNGSTANWPGQPGPDPDDPDDPGPAPTSALTLKPGALTRGVQTLTQPTLTLKPRARTGPRDPGPGPDPDPDPDPGPWPSLTLTTLTRRALDQGLDLVPT